MASAAWADSMPIRGATGEGFGQFSWGTSLATVEKLSPRMKPYPEEWRVRFERTALAQLRKADRAQGVKKGGKAALRRAPQGGPRFTGYRYWVKMDGLEGRVTLSFYRDQLFEANVSLIFPHRDRTRVDRYSPLPGMASARPQATVSSDRQPRRPHGTHRVPLASCLHD